MSSLPVVQAPSALTAAQFLPVMDIAAAVDRRNAIVQFVKAIMVEGVDHGKIPGVDKATLLQPGAEKLISFFGLTPIMECVSAIEDWSGRDHGGEPFFYYRYRCTLKRGDLVLGVEEASANSREVKYRYRWAKASELPPSVNKDSLLQRDSTKSELDFAINKGETSGRYGKPAEYWQEWRKAIAEGRAVKTTRPKKGGGTMSAWELPDIAYRIPNPEIADVVNTLQQMAEKRAKIRATRSCTGASEFFTQDVEDMETIVVEGTATTVAEPKGGTPAGNSAPPSQGSTDKPAGDAPPTGTAQHYDADPSREADMELVFLECTSIAELTTHFNKLPADQRRPGTKLFKAFQTRRDALAPNLRKQNAEDAEFTQ